MMMMIMIMIMIIITNTFKTESKHIFYSARI
jgi:hypothetical protein